ncbi:hypothetical protein SAMN05216524_103533 [Mucilaginibacter sp. OK098]|nr:hypothetical protein SAMN05216524_103533 [Mucilaginibacter sp. OK098]
MFYFDVFSADCDKRPVLSQQSKVVSLKSKKTKIRLPAKEITPGNLNLIF